MPIASLLRAVLLICTLTANAAEIDEQALSLDDSSMKQDDRSLTRSFQRIATFPVFLNTAIDVETVAEIVAASEDGKTLVYTDSAGGNLGFVDISDPHSPQPGGIVPLDGEPTSVAVAGDFALVVVNTSPNFTSPSGTLVIINIEQKRIKTTFELGGQPDAIAVSPDKKFAAIAIENERDEDLGEGRPPQAPAGFLVIVDLKGDPADWALRKVELTGVADLFPEDAEPEFVDINSLNIAAVTLQENNHIVLVHLPTGKIIRDFSAGSVDLEEVDVEENDLIELAGTLPVLPREPDGIAWLAPHLFATADEGDLDGGSRGFSIFNAKGDVRFTSGNALEHAVTRIGHYPEGRSENSGNEPENVEFGKYRDGRFLFVGSERSSVVFVFRIRPGKLALEQILPVGLGPEGLLAIPERDLFVAASEEDSREDKFRSALTIYKRKHGEPAYPTIRSADRDDGLPNPWGALSGLASGAKKPELVYTIYDSFYKKSRIFALDIGEAPAILKDEIVLNDTLSAVAQIAPSLVNDDGSVNLDPEGIALRGNGGFWIVSEGEGSVDDPERPVTSPNLLLRIAADGAIEQVVTLPATVNARQRRFGLEGVASVGTGMNEILYVAFQREWLNDPTNRARIGRYKVATGEWTFFYCPLEAPASPNGGFVGLSDLTPIGEDTFAVIERDDQAGADARIKRIYTFSVAGKTPLADPAAGLTPAFPVLEKKLARDVLPDLEATNGAVLEKIEGLTILRDGTALVVNDNDGVDDSSGETQLLRIEGLFIGN